jgi:hypothetical protein
MTNPITVIVDRTDAMLVGATLRGLAALNRSPDPAVAAQLERVGSQLTAAATVTGEPRIRGERGVI